MNRKSAVNLFHNSDDAAASARRGAAKNAALYVIDGEYAGVAKIMERTGLPKEKALDRLRRAKEKPGPLTWAKMGVVS